MRTKWSEMMSRLPARTDGRTPGWSILISRTTIGLYWNRSSTLPPTPVSASVRVVAHDLAASVAALGTGNPQPVMSVISSESDSCATFHCFSWGLAAPIWAQHRTTSPDQQVVEPGHQVEHSMRHV